MKHWESMGGEPISGTRADANRELWRRVAKLKGEERATFLRVYGDRGKAALVAALTLEIRSVGVFCPAAWMCWECPLDWKQPARMAVCGTKHTRCVDDAMDVYAHLLKKHGTKPEGAQ